MSGGWGDNIRDVVTRPWQFEPWMTRRREMEKLTPDDDRYRAAARIADAGLTGEMLDPTAGATHFLNPSFSKGEAVPCRLRRVVRDRLSAGTLSTCPMRAAPCWRERHNPLPHWEIHPHAHARRRQRTYTGRGRTNDT